MVNGVLELRSIYSPEIAQRLMDTFTGLKIKDDARNPSLIETDFFTVTKMDALGENAWFMCTPAAAEKLIAMDYGNLAVRETTIAG